MQDLLILEKYFCLRHHRWLTNYVYRNCVECRGYNNCLTHRGRCDHTYDHAVQIYLRTQKLTRILS